MSGICWLASYPKSGNTWLRAFLTNYQRDGEEPAPLDELNGGWTACLRHTFDEVTGIESGDLTRAQLDFYRPQVYEQLARDSDQPVFLKVHDAYRHGPDGRAVFSRQATTGAIYLIRNPLDVAVSYAHHRHEPVADTIRVMACEDAMLAGSDGPGDQLPQPLMSWSGHVSSWVDAPGLDIHVVRFEDMVRQPVAAFTAIVRFAGLAVDTRRLCKAIEFSRFEQLQSQELEHGFGEKQPTAVSFFRRGRIGSWREQLTDAQIQQLIADHRGTMRRFDYLSHSGEILC